MSFHWNLYSSGYREMHQVHYTSGLDRLSDLVGHQHPCMALNQFHAESIHGLCTAQQALRNLCYVCMKLLVLWQIHFIVEGLREHLFCLCRDSECVHDCVVVL